MPLFGSKKNKEQQYSEKGPAYPTQSAYPSQASAQMAQQPPPNYGQAPPPNYGQPPPPNYGQPPQHNYGPPQNYGQPGYTQGYAQGPPPPYYAAATNQPGYPTQPQNPQQPPQKQTVYVPGGFDAGARFGPSGANVPPPPPGCMPNAAQMAVSQGHNVVVTQRPSDFMTGGSDGGYVIW